MFFNSLAYRFGIRCFLSSAKQFKSKPNLRRASGKCKSQWHFGIRFSKPKAVVKCSKNRCTSANKVSAVTSVLVVAIARFAIFITDSRARHASAQVFKLRSTLRLNSSRTPMTDIKSLAVDLIVCAFLCLLRRS